MNNNYRTCPSCSKKFLFDENCVELEATTFIDDDSNGVSKIYVYCSQSCMEQKVKNIEDANAETGYKIESVSTEKISDGKWAIEVKVISPTLEQIG